MAEISFTKHVTLAVGVRDFDKAVAWYGDVLGSEVVYRLDDIAWGELTSPIEGVTLGLGETEEVKEGGITPTWGIDDLDAARAELERKGVKMDDLVEYPGMVRLTTFYDPDGNPWMFAESQRGETD